MPRNLPFLAAIAMLLVGLLAAPAALAQFPGANGEIVVQVSDDDAYADSSTFNRDRLIAIDPHTGAFTRMLATSWASESRISFGALAAGRFIARKDGSGASLDMAQYRVDDSGAAVLKSPVLLSQNSGFNTPYSDPDWLRGGKVVFVKQVWVPEPTQGNPGAGHYDYHLMRWDGVSIFGYTDLGVVTDNPMDVAGSAARDELFYSSGQSLGDAGQLWQVHRFDIATHTTQPILSTDQQIELGDVAPDGEHLLVTESIPFTGDATGLNPGEVRALTHNRIVEIGRDGGRRNVLTGDIGEYFYSPRYSPDGNSMAFFSRKVRLEGNQAVTVHSNVVRVTSLTGGGDGTFVATIVDERGSRPAATAWQLAWRPIGIAADFDITPVPGHPDQRKLTSRAQVAQYEGSTYHWDFGDGGSTDDGDGNIEIATWDKPGTYTVTHRVTAIIDGVERTATLSKTITLTAPELGVSLSWDPKIEDRGRLPNNRTFDATIRVSADADGVGTLHDLHFTDDAFAEIDPGALLDITAADDLPEPFDLAPGEHRDFPVTITTHPAKGDVTISVGVTGEDANGATVSGDFDVTRAVGFDFEVSVDDVEVASYGHPDEFEPMPDEGIDLTGITPSDAQVAPRNVRYDVSVENTSGGVANDVKLDLDDSVRDTTNRNPSAPDSLVITAYTVDGKPRQVVDPARTDIDDILIGSIDDEATVHIEVEAMAQSAGVVEALALAHGVSAGAEPRELSGHGSTDVPIDQKIKLFVDGNPALIPSSGTGITRAGDVWIFDGTIKNITPDETIDVIVLTETQGNVVGEPVQEDPAFAAGPFVENPMGVRKVLEPGDVLHLRQKYSSMSLGETTGSVQLHIYGRVDDDEAPDGHRLLTDPEIWLRDLTGGPSGEFEADRRDVVVDKSNPMIEPTPWEVYDLGYIFMDSFGRGIGRWTDSTWDAITSIDDAAIQICEWNWYAISTAYSALDPDERAAIKAQLAVYVEKLESFDSRDMYAAIDQAIVNKLEAPVAAWDNGDAAYFAAATGSVFGEYGPDVFLDAQVAREFTKLMFKEYGSKLMLRVGARQEGTLLARLAADGRHGFEPGDIVTMEHAFKYWGMDEALDERIREYVKHKKIMITMRDRGPGSVERLAEGYLRKIEKIKAKNVNEIDLYLGFAPEHMDTAMYKKMKDWDYYLERLPGDVRADEEKLRVVQERWVQRSEEYFKEKKIMEEYAAKGTLPVPNKGLGMNIVDNGYPELKKVPWDEVDFELARAGDEGSELVATLDGEEAFQPRVWHQGDGHAASYRAFTGDMDMISITDAQGRKLSKARRMEIYHELAAIGFEHPESLTWDNIKRNGYIDDFDMANPNSDVLLGYMPDGTRRAVKLDSRKSRYENAGANAVAGGFLLFRGMQMDWDIGEPTESPLPVLPTHIDGNSIVPREESNDQYMGPAGAEGATFTSSDPDAPLLRRNWDGTFSRWDAPTQRWVDYVPPAGVAVRQLPQSAVTNSVAAGASHVEIMTAANLGVGGAGQAWFKAGDQVIFNPGGANHEVATVQSIGSINTAAPLRFAHDSGELVGILPGSITRPTTGGNDSGSGSGSGSSTTQETGTPKVDPPVPTGRVEKPRIRTLPKVTGAARTGRTLRCSAGVWVTAARVTYSFVWQVKQGRRWVAIRRATRATYLVAASARGKQVRCSVTARNAGGAATAASRPVTVRR